jgi:phage protein D
MSGRIGANAITVEVDGQPLEGDTTTALIGLVVDDHLLLPDTFELTLQEPDDLTIGDKAHLRVGSVVKISASAEGDADPGLLIHGEVTALEGVYRGGKAAYLVARGYDHVHRLSRGRRSAVYSGKDSDIAREVARQAGLQVGTIDDSGPVHQHVGQVNQTDWDFLRARATAIGFEVAVVEGKLDFRKPRPASEAPAPGDLSSTNPLQLVMGQDLVEFRPRVTSAGQVAKVEVRGWDPKERQPVVATAPAGTSLAELRDTPASLAGVFGEPVLVVEGRYETARTAEAAARALAEKVGGAAAEAVGVARGNPRLRAGAAVSVSQVAAPFAGRYTLTHTRHTFDPRNGYLTHFDISGRQDRSLAGLVAGVASGGGAAAGGGPGAAAGGSGGSGGAGVVVAIVTDTNDPDGLGRVKLQFPTQSADYVSNWARVVAPGAGADRGLVWIPEVHDEVLVAFESGDRQRPFVIGGLWNGVDKPPPIDLDGGELQARRLVSRLSNEVYLRDMKRDSSLGMKTGKGEVTFHLSGTDRELKGTSTGKIVLTADSDIEIKATGKVSISGTAGVEITSSAQAKLEGSAGVSVKAGGVVEVGGAQVKLG